MKMKIETRSPRIIGMAIDHAFLHPYDSDIVLDVLKNNVENFTLSELNYFEAVILKQIELNALKLTKNILNDWFEILQIIYVYQEIERLK